ncbi:MAG: hypothetical protein NVS4B6_01320 [Mycobacterium sp.]
MGRHELARARRKPSALLAAAIAPAVVLFAAGADVHPSAPGAGTHPVVARVATVADTAAPVSFEVVEAASMPPLVENDGQPNTSSPPVELVSASRWRVVTVPRLLPVGVAPEKGLQIKTILAERAISAAFPEIHEIGGVRPDPLPWHPLGLALDVMIPNPSTPEGIELGNEIVAYALKNAKRFDLQDAIWRGTYYTPGGGRSPIAGHYDHVHITTHGDGYPTGDEFYYR